MLSAGPPQQARVYAGRSSDEGHQAGSLARRREWTANVVGIDAHKRTLTAPVVDGRGEIVASERFRVSGDGHRALAAWARSFGPIARWGIEGASGWSRHTALLLAGREQDARDVCATQTAV
jgi:hypothetical protein